MLQHAHNPEIDVGIRAVPGDVDVRSFFQVSPGNQLHGVFFDFVVVPRNISIGLREKPAEFIRLVPLQFEHVLPP